jgi:KDO2-lipid IV(A) lauroyltransferase
MALTVVEWFILRRWSREKLIRTFPEVVPPIEQLRADVGATGRGAVGLTAHFGNWEVLALFYGRHLPGFLVPIANRVYFKKYQDFFHEMRTGCGLEVIYSDESPRKMLRALKDRKMPSFLPDMDLRTNSGIFVDFFGLPTYTITFPAQLARKGKTIMVIALFFREGKKFKVFYSGPLEVPDTGDEEADVASATQRWTQILEEQIRQHPSQWSWVQNRWRTTPDQPRRKRDRKRKRASIGRARRGTSERQGKDAT